MDAGAMGYVLKDSSREELIRAIRSVSEGRQYLCSAVAQTVMSGYLRPDAAKPSADPMERVTNREREVLIKIAGGLSSKMIARELGLSVKTIEKHRANLMRKLELRNAAEVTMFAVRHGLLPRDPDAGLGGTFEP
jgi:DNA-binding NarL/FixJ family response regulator